MAAWLFTVMDVHDPQGYEAYRAQVAPLIAAAGGRYVVRGGATRTVEGTWPKGRTVILEFPDMAALDGFMAGPDYAPVKAIRHRTARSVVIAAEGYPDAAPAVPGRAYLVGNNSVTDPARFKAYADRVPGLLTAAGGRYLVRGGAARVLEGDWPAQRLVIAEFPSMGALEAFYFGPAYGEILPIRLASGDGNVVLVEGYAGG
ncbi:MAG: DUF1330 domain-containing protein [Alphaproteobacteria bacterium]